MNTAAETAPQPWWRVVMIGRNPRFTLVRLAVWVIALVLISKFLLLPVRVQGISMLPNYRDHGFNLVNRLAYVSSEPRRGDVVAIRYTGEHVMLLKRIIGLPGDVVGFHNGRAIVNGQILPEPYLSLPCDWDRAPERCGPDEYFVVGDNRSMPQENHVFGRAKRYKIVGKTIL